jgi:hypothetical protein
LKMVSHLLPWIYPMYSVRILTSTRELDRAEVAVSSEGGIHLHFQRFCWPHAGQLISAHRYLHTDSCTRLCPASVAVLTPGCCLNWEKDHRLKTWCTKSYCCSTVFSGATP